MPHAELVRGRFHGLREQDGMHRDPVDILLRRDGLKGRSLVDVRAAGVLEQDAVHFRIAGQVREGADRFGGCGGGGRPMCRDLIPAFVHRARFMRAYVADAGSSPTSAVARQGLVPVRREISAALAATSSTMRSARLGPSMSWAI